MGLVVVVGVDIGVAVMVAVVFVCVGPMPGFFFRALNFCRHSVCIRRGGLRTSAFLSISRRGGVTGPAAFAAASVLSFKSICFLSPSVCPLSAIGEDCKISE